MCVSAVSASKSIRVFVQSTMVHRTCARKPRGDGNVKVRLMILLVILS